MPTAGNSQNKISTINFRYIVKHMKKSHSYDQMRIQDIYQSKSHKKKSFSPLIFLYALRKESGYGTWHMKRNKKIKMEFKINERIKTHIKRFFSLFSFESFTYSEISSDEE